MTMLFKFLKNSFWNFARKFPYLAVPGVILLMLVSAQWYYRRVCNDPNLQYVRIGVEQGLSIDSVLQLRNEQLHIIDDTK